MSEFKVKIWKPLMLSWHKRQLIIRENDYVIQKTKKDSKTYSLINAVIVDQTKGNELEIIIRTGDIKNYIRPVNKEDKDKIINRMMEIIKKFSSKTAFSAEYQRYNREIAKFHDASPYDSLIRKLNIFQNLMLEMNQKLDTLKTLSQKKSQVSSTDFMSCYNNLITIKEEMKKQFDGVIAGVYNYHDMIEKKIDKNKGINENIINTNDNKSDSCNNLSKINEPKADSEMSSDEEDKSEDDPSNVPVPSFKYSFLSSKIADFYNKNFDIEQRKTLPKITCPQNMIKELVPLMTKRQPFPIYFNEPISMCQKQCEKFCYLDLLNKAANKDEPELQMAYIAAFIISELFMNVGRNLKPFSPIIGETYEYFDNNKQFRYMAEQVCHSPQITAFIAETPSFAYFGDTDNTNSFKIFKGCFELIFKNKITVYLKKTRDCYTFNRPNAMLKGIVKPPLHSDYSGTVSIEHTEDPNYKCVIEFTEENWNGDEKQMFEGKIYSDTETVSYIIKGNWGEEVFLTDKNGDNKISIIKFDQNEPYLKNTYDNYLLPEFTCNLNNTNDTLNAYLPKTDSRFREDMRIYESGTDRDKAQEIKLKYEEKQRKELDVPEHKAKYFNIVEDEVTEEKYYIPNGKYWEEKKKKLSNKKDNKKHNDLDDNIKIDESLKEQKNEEDNKNSINETGNAETGKDINNINENDRIFDISNY